MQNDTCGTLEEPQRLRAQRAVSPLREGLAVSFGRRWVTIEDLRAKNPSGQRPIGTAGLWKWVGDGGGPCRVFEVPAWCVSLRPEEDPDELELSGPLPLSRYVDWAAATRAGSVPAGWQMPADELVQSWIRPGDLTVRSRGCLRQIEMVLEQRCWGLRMPLAPLHPGLPKARRRALEALAEDLESRVAMVRIGIAGRQPPMLVAEVGLTGGPASDLLFSAGLDALRHVARLVETAEVLSDASVRIACLADAETATHPRKEKDVNTGAE